MFFRTTNLAATLLLLSTALFGLQACGGGSTATDSSTTTDTTAPTVKQSSFDTTPVDYKKVITVTFSESIKAVDADIVLHSVTGQGTAAVMKTVPTTINVNGALLTITPTASTPLLPASDYHLVLKNSIKDNSGNSFVSKQYSFTTSAAGNSDQDVTPPTIKSSSMDTPPVDYSKPLVVTFDENIIAAATSVTLTPTAGGADVTVSVVVIGAVLTITPSIALLPTTNYDLVLNNTITDIALNPFAGKTYSFITTAIVVGGGTKTITFIELNDLHANLVPHSELVRQGAGQKVLVAERGGLVRIAAKIDEIRKLNLQRTAVNSTILMNIGDTYHGGAEAMFSVGNSIVAPVDALGIDIAVPGNWDFAYGPQVTNFRYGVLVDPATPKQVEVPNIKFLAANAIYKTPTFDVTLTSDYKTAGRLQFPMKRVFDNLIANINNDAQGQPITITPANPVPFLPATDIQIVNGVKVGFIGLTSDIVKLMHPMMALNIEFTQGQANYVTLVSDLANSLRTNDKVDLVVVMSELGIQKDIAIADLLPTNAVNIIFSAHTHELTKTMLTTKSGTVVVEAGNDTYLGQMDVTLDNTNAVTYLWTIHPIDGSIIPDMNIAYIKNVQDLVTQARLKYLNVDPASPINIPQVTLAGVSGGTNFVTPQSLSQSLDVTVGRTTVALDRRNALESNFNNAYTDLLRNTQSTDLAVTPGFRFDSAVMPAPLATDNWIAENNITLTGDITIADVYRFMPAPYFLATADTTIVNIKKVLEGGLDKTFSPTVFNQEGGWMFGYSGLNINVDLTKPLGKRVLKIVANFANANTNIAIGNVLFDASLAVNGGSPFPLGNNLALTIAGCGRPFDLPNLVCSMPGFSNVMAVTNGAGGIGPNANKYPASDFLINNISLILDATVVSTRKDITDASATPMWPQSEFVQPQRGVPLVP